MELSQFLFNLEKDLDCECKSCGFKQKVSYGTWNTPDEIVLKIRNAHKDFNEDCAENGEEDLHVITLIKEEEQVEENLSSTPNGGDTEVRSSSPDNPESSN